MVGGPEQRERALCPPGVDPLKISQLSIKQYVVLELVGACRRHGVSRIFLTSFTKSDPRSTFHYTRSLAQNGFITIQVSHTLGWGYTRRRGSNPGALHSGWGWRGSNPGAPYGGCGYKEEGSLQVLHIVGGATQGGGQQSRSSTWWVGLHKEDGQQSWGGGTAIQELHMVGGAAQGGGTAIQELHMVGGAAQGGGTAIQELHIVGGAAQGGGTAILGRRDSNPGASHGGWGCTRRRDSNPGAPHGGWGCTRRRDSTLGAPCCGWGYIRRCGNNQV